MQIAKLSAAKLEAAIEKANRAEMFQVDAMIGAGRGNERISEIRVAAQNPSDLLAIAYCEALNAGNALRNEAERRKRYHGSLKPVKAV